MYHLPSESHLESNMVEILRENPQGLHAKDIAAQNGMDPTKICRYMSYILCHVPNNLT